MKQRVNRMLWILRAVISAMVAGCAAKMDAAIHLSPMTPVSPPTLTTTLPGRRSTPVVGASENGALLVWDESATFGGPTNIMALAISREGNMVDRYGQFVGVAGFAGTLAQVFPAGDEFYVVFHQSLSLQSPRPTTVFARLDANGRVITPPQIIATNVLDFVRTYQFVSDSNGQSLLSAWLDSSGSTYFALFRRDGGVVRTSLPTAANTSMPMKLSSVGRTYLLVQEDRSARLEAIAVDAYTGATFTNRFTTANGFKPIALSSDGSQYLLATESTADTNYSNQFYLLSGDGRVLATGGATNLPRLSDAHMFPFAGGWVVWGFQSYGQITSYGVAPSGGSVVVGASPLPPISGLSVAPFGNYRFIVAEQLNRTNIAYKIVAASGESAPQSPWALSQQTLATVASGDSGFLALWEETAQTMEVRGMRFANDGTVDAGPFIVVSNVVSAPIRAVFETNLYHVIWRGSSDGRLIDAEGLPNARRARPLAIGNAPDLEVTTLNGGLLAYQRTRNNTQLISAEGITNLAGMASLSGADDRLFEAIVTSSQLRAGVASNLFSAPVLGNVLGATTNPVAVATMGTNFFLAWRDLRSSNIIAAVTADGTVAKTNILFTNTPASTVFTAVGNDNHALLAVTFPDMGGPATTLLALYDAPTKTYSTASEILVSATNSVSITSLQNDFVIASTLWGESGPYAAIQLVTAVTPVQPRASADAGTLAVDFTSLDPTRTYLIQRSTNLVTWQTVETVKQLETWPFSAPISGTSAFYRAILQPQ